MKKPKIELGDLNGRIYCSDDLLRKIRIKYRYERDKYSVQHGDNFYPYVNMVTKKGRFKTGLFYFIRDFLSEMGVEYNVEDHRSIQSMPDMEDIKTRLKHLPYTLRPYQREALLKGLKKRYGFFQHATGSGKTVTLAALLLAWWKKSLIVTNSVDLAQQLKNDLSELLDEEIGMIGNGVFDPKFITVGIDKTLIGLNASKNKKNRMNDFCESIDYFVCDEAHHISSKSWRKIARQCKNASIRHGFSATAVKRYSEDVGEDMYVYSYFGPMLDQRSIKELINQGYLAEPKVKIIKNTVYNDYNYHDFQEEYERIIVKDDDRNDIICRLMNYHYRKDEQIIGFVRRLEHGRKIARKLVDDYDIPKKHFAFVNGQNAEDYRNKNISLFEAGQLPIIFGTVIGEGLNFFCDAGVNIEGGKGEKITKQKMGRILRKKEMDDETGDVDRSIHETVMWYDFADNGHKWFSKHSETRLEILFKEGYDIEIVDQVEEIFHPDEKDML